MPLITKDDLTDITFNYMTDEAKQGVIRQASTWYDSTFVGGEHEGVTYPALAPATPGDPAFSSIKFADLPRAVQLRIVAIAVASSMRGMTRAIERMVNEGAVISVDGASFPMPPKAKRGMMS